MFDSESVPRTGVGALPDPRFLGQPSTWTLSAGVIDLDPPVVMGILNVTPDSFSDGGSYASVEEVVARAELMVQAGAGILDVGGESTRPGADPVVAEEELARVLPVVAALCDHFEVPVSVDTRRATVARAALECGAAIVNDTSGLRRDPQMVEVVAAHDCGVVIMHTRGTPRDMRERASYQDLLAEVEGELADSVELALTAGVARERIVLDPGIGFAKGAEQSLNLLRGLRSLAAMGFPLMVGPSRKSFLGEVLGLPPEDRVEGTIAACLAAYQRGALIFRVHDVRAVVRALCVARAIEEGRV